MNLTLKSSDINFIGVSSDNETITIQDAIGFSTADLDSGFNTSDADPKFQDASAQNYPEMDEVVALLFAWHIPFNDELDEDENATGTPLAVTRVSDTVLTSLTDAQRDAGDFDYGDNANEWKVAAPKDGWIKFKMIVLDKDASSDAYYYDSANSVVRKTSDDSEVTDVTAIIDELDEVAEVSLLKTSLLDENIGYVQKSYTMAQVRGKCADEDTWRKHITILQVGRTTAKIEFDSYGNMFSAAQIIEYLDSYIAKHSLEKPNT